MTWEKKIICDVAAEFVRYDFVASNKLIRANDDGDDEDNVDIDNHNNDGDDDDYDDGVK